MPTDRNRLLPPSDAIFVSNGTHSKVNPLIIIVLDVYEIPPLELIYFKIESL
jgi:hypothetical protein